MLVFISSGDLKESLNLKLILAFTPSGLSKHEWHDISVKSFSYLRRKFKCSLVSTSVLLFMVGMVDIFHSFENQFNSKVCFQHILVARTQWAPL